jgi:hypothetical protein
MYRRWYADWGYLYWYPLMYILGTS